MVLAGASTLLPRPLDLLGELKTFSAAETKAMAAYGAAVKDARGRKSFDGQFADRMEKEVIPPWVAERRRLARFKSLPDRQQKVISLLLQYMEAREQGWIMLAGGCRNHDMQALVNAGKKQAEAEKFVGQLRSLPR